MDKIAGKALIRKRPVYSGPKAKIVVYDITKKENPKKIKRSRDGRQFILIRAHMCRRANVTIVCPSRPVFRYDSDDVALPMVKTDGNEGDVTA